MSNKLSNVIRTMIVVLLVSSFLVGCASTNGGDKETNQIGQEEMNGENTGLVHERTMELKYAKHFAVDYYKDGYKVITDASDRKILIVPEGKEVPEMEEEMVVIQKPIETVSIYSTIDAAWFRPIGALDRIVATTFEASSWRIPEIVEGLENGNISYIGKTSALDYELLQAVAPTVNLLSKSSQEELFPKYDELGLDYISMGAYLEEDPRARLEWVKFTSALFDKEEEAIQFFDEELARMDAVSKKAAESTEEKLNVAFVYFSPSKSVFYVHNGKGHHAVTTEIAGGVHYPKDFAQDKNGFVPTTNEEFYKIMSDVDLILYDNISGHGIQNMNDLLEKASFVSDLKVVEEGRIWGLQKEFWQSADKIADITEALNSILTTPHGEMTENDYYFLMK